MEQLNNNTIKQNQEDVIDLRKLVFKYLRKWYWFVLSVVLCCALGVFYILRQNPSFQVASTVMIRTDEPDLGSIPGIDMLQNLGLSTGSRVVESELYIINSQTLMRQVIQTLDIQTDYYKKDGLRYTEQYPSSDVRVQFPVLFTDTMKKALRFTLIRRADDYKIKMEYGSSHSDFEETYIVEDLRSPIQTPFGVFSFDERKKLEPGDRMKINTLPMLNKIEAYRKDIKATQVKKESNVLTVSTTTTTPRKAIDMINKLVELYNLDAVIDKNIMASNTARFVDERLQLITKELSDVEEDVERYKKENQLTDISSEARLFLETSSEYQKKAAELETQLNLIQYIQDYVTDEKNKYGLIPANLGVTDAALVKLIEEYNTALLERMKLLRTTNEQNPVITQMEDQLVTVRANIVSSINSLKDGINIARQDVALKDNQFMSRIKSVPTQERQYIEIKRQQQIKETLYLFLFQKREETALTLASTVQPAKIIDKADYLPDPVAPRKMVILFLCVILGMCIPVVWIFVYEFFHDYVEDTKEFKSKIETPFAGQIANSTSKEPIVVRAGNVSPEAELFRLVRTNLHFMLPSRSTNPCVLITSTINGEGKTFIALNLAMSVALTGKKVVVIGLDIRKPQLANYLHLKNKGRLTEFLADDTIELNDIIVPSGISANLDVIPAGPIPPNPSELLLSERLDNLFEQLKKQYDYIIIDSAPIGLVSDTFVLNKFVDATLYVSRAKYTPRDCVDFINDLYQKKRLNNMSCVLNGAETKVSSYGYGYGYGYGHNIKK